MAHWFRGPRFRLDRAPSELGSLHYALWPTSSRDSGLKRLTMHASWPLGVGVS